jgi:hypothetical protein
MKRTVQIRTFEKEVNGISISLPICQRKEDEFFEVTSICKAFGKDFEDYKINKETQELIEDLTKILKSQNSGELKLIDSKRGRYGGTYVHPYVFGHFAQWVNRNFRAQVAIWIGDGLINHRNKTSELHFNLSDAIAENIRYSKGLFIQENIMLKRVLEVKEKDYLDFSDAELLEKRVNLQKHDIALIKSGIKDRKKREEILNNLPI